MSSKHEDYAPGAGDLVERSHVVEPVGSGAGGSHRERGGDTVPSAEDHAGPVAFGAVGDTAIE